MNKKKKSFKGKKRPRFDIDKLYRKSRRRPPELAILEEIEKSKLSYQKIARKLGSKHRTTIHKLINAKNPTFDSLKQIAFALDIPVKKLIKDY